MAFVSILFIILGFLIAVFSGVKLSLTSVTWQENGELNNAKINMYTTILSVGSLMVVLGVLGYYAMRMNLPYYVNGNF